MIGVEKGTYDYELRASLSIRHVDNPVAVVDQQHFQLARVVGVDDSGSGEQKMPHAETRTGLDFGEAAVRENQRHPSVDKKRRMRLHGDGVCRKKVVADRVTCAPSRNNGSGMRPKNTKISLHVGGSME